MCEIKHKVISKSGGLTIPSSIRREYNILGGDAVDIVIMKGQLVIRPHTPRCVFCKGQEYVGKYMDRYVCQNCVTAMVKDVGTNG